MYETGIGSRPGCTTGSGLYPISCHGKCPEQPDIPVRIVASGHVVNLLFKNTGQCFIFRCQESLAHNSSGSFPCGIEDEDTPAAIVPADLRACLVDGTVSFHRRCIIPEEGACLGTFGENTCIIIEGYLVRVNNYRCFFTRVLVIHQEVIIPGFFYYLMNQPQVAAALSTLTAFKRQEINLQRLSGTIGIDSTTTKNTHLENEPGMRQHVPASLRQEAG